ncbi:MULTISPECIES: DNA translocase FtsK [unclassified Lentimicrobium]|uniref:FtsK/SpoIIIE family DNA translocase n=1 Tax=unclassified Lentimicrobium TaxID=2677434 RepID=UPI0015530AC2|nr:MULTISPECIES: DNA translocase FtsK [unclassified Lentimicrobium]NPD45957.1 DNA translocase FtsK [Lentimicrobium sp. S6]NPD84276.1 DNA translocase FtsK [Lentimicrobium sp. L6]
MAKKTNKTKPESPKKSSTKTKKKSSIKAPSLSFIQSDKFKLSLGIFLLLLSIYMTFSFLSYLFYWTADYDKVYNFEWSDLSGTVPVNNWGGYLGAWLGHLFIYKMFGIASFLFILIFFLMGSNLTLRISFLPFKKTLKISFVTMLWSAVFFGSIFHHSALAILGGTFGHQVSSWIQGLMGMTGLIIILAFSLISFLIVHFNFPMKWFNRFYAQKSKNNIQDKDETTTNFDENNNGDKYNTNEYAVKEIEKTEDDKEWQDSVPTPEPVIIKEEDNSGPITLVHEEETKLKKKNNPNLDLELDESMPIDIIENTITESSSHISESISDIETESVTGMNVSIGKEEVVEETKSHSIDTPYDPTEDLSDYQLPQIDILEDHGSDKINIYKEELEANKNRIVETLNHYNIKIQKIKATVGPTVTLYEIVPAPGVRISKIRNLEDDIALSLSALGIRIIAPIPGKGSIGIEVPNSKPEIVPMRAVIQSKIFQDSTYELPVVMGKTISNESYIFDLAKMPHLLMAGATGQGKSVGLNAIITSLLYKKHPAQLKFVMVDPKKVELTLFSKIERHFLAKLPDSEEAIITDTQAVVQTLYSLVKEMDNRYDLLKDAQVRNIKEYNAKFIARRLNPNNGHKYMPYIVLVVDEFADLMMTAGKEVEGPIARLAQLARAIGIHLIIATQRPSVNVITGIIKANFPARIAFRVTSRIDSRTILDSGGADQLIGRGDMLMSTGNDMVRIQCAFIDTPEVDSITEFIGSQRAYTSAYILPESESDIGDQGSEITIADRDELFEDAARVIVNAQQGSTSLIQRKLKLGYNRAGRIIDQLESVGIVGQFEGSKAREVRVANEMALEQFLKDLYAKELE